MGKRFVLLLILFGAVAVPARARAEAPRTESEPSSRKEDRRRAFLDDGRYLLTFPSRTTRRGVILTSTVLAATGFLITQDEEIREWVGRHRTDASGDLERIFEPIGRFEAGLAITTGGYLIGRLAKRPKLQKTSAVAFESFLYTAAITAAAKGLFARETPKDPGNNGAFWEGGDHFPSGHTSRTFAIAAVFAESYGRKAASIGYPIAGLVGLARIESGDHWASDVLAGAALGIAIGRGISRRHFRAEVGPGPRVAFDPRGTIRLTFTPGNRKRPGRLESVRIPEWRREGGIRKPGRNDPDRPR